MWKRSQRQLKMLRLIFLVLLLRISYMYIMSMTQPLSVRLTLCHAHGTPVNCQQLLSYGWNFMIYFFHSRTLPGLIFYRYCMCSHSTYEFMRITAMPCLANKLLQTATISGLNSFQLQFCNDSRALDWGMCYKYHIIARQSTISYFLHVDHL